MGAMAYGTQARAYQACPVFNAVPQIHLTLTAPGKPDELRELLKSRYEEDYFAGTLKSATGMDVQTFYQPFGDESRRVCLSSLAQPDR